MSAPGRADAFARWWVHRYTAALPAAVARRRRSEIRSDVWEQRAWATEAGIAPARVAVSITRRVVVGMAADLWWRRAQLAAARGRGAVSGATMWSLMRRTWWRALAVLIGAIEVGTGIAAPFEDPPGALVVAVVVAGAGTLVLTGVAVRQRRPVRGDLMIAVGVLPVVPWYWTYVFPIAGVTVIAAALVDAADAASSDTAAEPPAADPVRGVLVAALIAAIGGGVVMNSADAVVLVSPVLAALVAHAIVRRRTDVTPTARAGLLLAGVGGGNLAFTVAAGVLGLPDDTLSTSAVAVAGVLSGLCVLAGIVLLMFGRSPDRAPHST